MYISLLAVAIRLLSPAICPAAAVTGRKPAALSLAAAANRPLSPATTLLSLAPSLLARAASLLAAAFKLKAAALSLVHTAAAGHRLEDAEILGALKAGREDNSGGRGKDRG
jgi:hypothetical protein